MEGGKERAEEIDQRRRIFVEETDEQKASPNIQHPKPSHDIGISRIWLIQSMITRIWRRIMTMRITGSEGGARGKNWEMMSGHGRPGQETRISRRGQTEARMWTIIICSWQLERETPNPLAHFCTLLTEQTVASVDYPSFSFFLFFPS